MNCHILSCVFFVVSVGGCLAGDAFTVPDFPKGFEVTPEAKSVNENVSVESIRLSVIIFSRKDMFDNEPAIRAFKQQAKRMLRMDDATRADLIRTCISRLAGDVDFSPAFKDEFLHYSAEVLVSRLRRLESPLDIESLYPKTDVGHRDKVVEFALLYLLVLKPRNINLEMPKGIYSMQARYADIGDDYKHFAAACLDFFLRCASSDDVQRYIVVLMALIPKSGNYLKTLQDHLENIRNVHGLPSTKINEILKEGIALNDWITVKAKLEWTDVAGKCLSDRHSFVNVIQVFKEMGIWPGEQAVEKAIGLLETIENKTEAQKDLLKSLKHKLENQIVDPYDRPEPKVKGTHPLFGF